MKQPNILITFLVSSDKKLKLFNKNYLLYKRQQGHPKANETNAHLFLQKAMYELQKGTDLKIYLLKYTDSY